MHFEGMISENKSTFCFFSLNISYMVSYGLKHLSFPLFTEIASMAAELQSSEGSRLKKWILFYLVAFNC